MASMLSRSNSGLLSRLQALTNLQLQFQVPRLNHTLSGRDMNSEFPPEVAHQGEANMSKWKKLDARGLGVTRMMIPPSPWVVLNHLHGKGFQVYLVGGCVRDLILKRVPKDFDVITTASLKEVKKIFYRCQIVGRRFPVCMVRIKDSIIEVSSFQTVARTEKEKEKVFVAQTPSDCGEADSIIWRDTMRRDFTVNSLFYDPFVNKIYDYGNGISDLRALKLQTLIPAQVSFKEDCARILRGLRIAARLGLSLSKDIETAIHDLSSSIKTLDKARLMLELNYMLSYGASEHSFHLLQKVNLLEILFPFHAAYLAHQSTEKVAQKSTMLMKLFSNLDRFITCDQPSNSKVWVGLLAFHLALVNNPQDALVVRAFASALYQGNWKEGAKFARELAQVQVNFVPEISGSSDFYSDEKLAEGVRKLAYLVQTSVAVLTDADKLFEVMSRFPGSPCSHLAFITKKTRNSVHEIFQVLADDIESYQVERENFDINYHMLGLGRLCETRFVLGKVILETMNDGVVQTRRDIDGKEEDHPRMHEIVDGQKSAVIKALSGLKKQEVVVNRSKKRQLSQSSPGLGNKGENNSSVKSTSNKPLTVEEPKRFELEQVKKRLKMLSGKPHSVQDEPKEQKRAAKYEFVRKCNTQEDIIQEKQGTSEKLLQGVNGSQSKSLTAISGKQQKEKKCNTIDNETMKQEEVVEKKDIQEKMKKQNRILAEKKTSLPTLHSLFK